MHLPSGMISETVRTFLRDDSTNAPSRRRERSWDFCFNYFQDNPRPTRNMELSCLQLGYYLASWGMLRGSAFLFKETNALHYRSAIEVIEQHNEAMLGVDVDQYNEDSVLGNLDSAWYAIRDSLLPEGGSASTLVSKVMMGVWGCLPSYDTYFVRTMRHLAGEQKIRGLRGVSHESLLFLHEIWKAHEEEIEAVRHSNPPWTFQAGTPGARPMTRAKVLDIFGFQYSWA